jgi:hypothetical protein
MTVELGKARNYTYWSDRSVAETFKKEYPSSIFSRFCISNDNNNYVKADETIGCGLLKEESPRP